MDSGSAHPVKEKRLEVLTATAMTTGMPTIGSDSRWMRSETCCRTTLSGIMDECLAVVFEVVTRRLVLSGDGQKYGQDNVDDCVIKTL